MTESDWKKFSTLVHDWRERYLEQRNQEIAESLRQSGKTPTECFWETREEIEQEVEKLEDCFDGPSRSKMPLSLLLMHRHGIISADDLRDFSDELQEETKRRVAALRDDWHEG